MISIGELSRRSGVKIPTIRYYEQQGLLQIPERSVGNQRRYTLSDLERLKFIRLARELGLSLKTIVDFIALSASPDQPCEKLDQIACDHLATVREKISKLKGLERELERIVAGCGKGNVISNCYVLRAFSDHGLCTEEH